MRDDILERQYIISFRSLNGHSIVDMNTKKSIIISGTILIALVVMGVFFATTKDSNIFEKDTTVKDLHIPTEEEVTIKNGSTLTSTGNMVIDGTLSCEHGPLSLVAKGDLYVRGTLRCILPDDALGNSLDIGLQIVATRIIFEKSATIDTNGHIIIVNEDSKLPHSKDTLDAMYAEVLKNSGDEARVGPCVDKKQLTSLSSQESDHREHLLPQSSSFIKVAYAQEVEGNASSLLELRGTWNIGEKDPSERRISNPQFFVDMGTESNITIADLLIHGAKGVDGQHDVGSSCEARGGHGGDAFRVRIKAGHIVINDGTIKLGDGGNGGDANTLPNCKEASATGGNGGKSGNIKITATKDIVITSFHVDPGTSGNGGNAIAIAEDGINSCGNTNGGNAEAIGGNGGENKKDLAVTGKVTGIERTQVSRVVGGRGGDAIAKPGNGAVSTDCSCATGVGGNSKAAGGNGGNAAISIPMSTGEARGGDGGNAEAFGGNGGNGQNCPSNFVGATGGNGGNALSTAGLPGRGTTATGRPGVIKNSSGGNGGLGSDGCPPASGGMGGVGTPLGIHGKEGNTTCVGTEQPQTPKSDALTLIKAIIYKGKYLPLDQIIITNEPGCGEEHWRAELGSVKATDGTIVPDADVVCGYGKVTENKPVLTTKQVATVDTAEFASTTDIFKFKP